MMQTERPNSIKASRQRSVVEIEWGDSHRSEYSFALLRAACPCAYCRGGHEQMSSEPPVNVFEIHLPDSSATHLVGIEPVGSYGVVLVWEDGHRDGIYTWHYLRALCPCKKCRESANKE